MRSTVSSWDGGWGGGGGQWERRKRESVKVNMCREERLRGEMDAAYTEMSLIKMQSHARPQSQI